MDYKARHETAMKAVDIRQSYNAHESAIVGMFKSWKLYANAYHFRFESKIGEDYVLGPEWVDVGLALIGLLNGETGGRIDCGTLDREIRETFVENGFTDEGAQK